MTHEFFHVWRVPNPRRHFQDEVCQQPTKLIWVLEQLYIIVIIIIIINLVNSYVMILFGFRNYFVIIVMFSFI